jgi:arylsulfatase A-like enzyme
VDWTVGQVLQAIDQSQEGENTLLIYSSDNGSFMYRQDAGTVDHVSDETVQAYSSDHHTANHVFRGTKADIWEGGHRVPFFARWPAVVEPGSQTAATICLTDFFATAADLIGKKVPVGAAPDSYSFLPLLQGREPETPRPPVIHHSVRGMFAVRDGDWKLILGNGSGGREQPAGSNFERPFQLFNLRRDISESIDLAEQQPETVRRLEKAFQEVRGPE